jgi:hypothetical protein
MFKKIFLFFFYKFGYYYFVLNNILFHNKSSFNFYIIYWGFILSFGSFFVHPSIKDSIIALLFSGTGILLKYPFS